MKPHFTHFSACLLALLVSGRAQPTADGAPPVAASAARITHQGQAFELAQHQENGDLETDEYLPVGETLADWSQLVTVQRLRRPTSVQEAAEFIKTSFEKEFSAEVRQLEHSSRHVLLIASVPAQKSTCAHKVLCLVSASLAANASLVVVQFAQRQDSPSSASDVILNSWRERLSALAKTGVSESQKAPDGAP